MARYPRRKKQGRKSHKIQKQEVYSTVYKSKKRRLALTGGTGSGSRQLLKPGQQSLTKPPAATWSPQIGFTNRAKVLGAEIIHHTKVAGREVKDKFTPFSDLKTQIKNLKNAYSLFRLKSMKFDIQVKELINYFTGTITSKLLTPISAGTVTGGIFSKKPTKPIITVSDASMATSLANKYLYRLANIRYIPTQSFLDRCSLGTIKKHVARLKNIVTLKAVRKHTSDKMNNFERYGEPQYRFLLCRIYNYRVQEIAYNHAYQNLVTITKQILNNTIVSSYINVPASLYYNTLFNGISYFRTDQTSIEQLDQKVDTLIDKLNKHITQDNKPIDRKAEFISKEILKKLTAKQKLTETINWIITNALHQAKRVDITRKLFYNLTNIRPTDELTYTPQEYTNWFLSASKEDKESKASDRRAFITELNQLNSGIQALANLLKPQVERLIREGHAAEPVGDLKEEQIKALEYAYRYYNKPGRQSADVTQALEVLGADPTLSLHGAKPTLSTLIERIRERINELKGPPADPEFVVVDVEDGEEEEEDLDKLLAGVGGSVPSSTTTSSARPPASTPAPATPLKKPTTPTTPITSHINPLFTKLPIPTPTLTPEKAVRALGDTSTDHNRHRIQMTGGAIFTQYYTDLTPGSDMVQGKDYIIDNVEPGYKYIKITEAGLLKIQSKILFLLQRPFFISDKTLLERGKMAKQGDKPYESESFKTTYYNYLAKLDMGVTEFDIKQSQIPVKFPENTILNNLPGFVSTYLYRQYYVQDPNVNYSDLCLIDLKVLDKLKPTETTRKDSEMLANKHYVYLASASAANKDKERIVELFGDAAKQGAHITIPPSFLQYALLTPAELSHLLKMADKTPGYYDLGDLRDRVTNGSLNPGKMDDLKTLMDDAGIMIIRNIYKRLAIYMKNSPVISQDNTDDSLLRVAFDNCLSKIMLFLKLNHLFGDFIRFKKFEAKEENKSTTGKPAESKQEQVTIDQLIEFVSSGNAPPKFTEAMLANILLDIGMSNEIKDVDELHKLLGELLKRSSEEEEGDEEDGKETAGPSTPRKAASPLSSTSSPVKPSSSPLSAPSSPVKPSSSLPSPSSSPVKPSSSLPSPSSSPAKPSSSPSSILVKPPPMLAIKPAPEPKKANNGVTRVPYCAYPVAKLDIGKKEIGVSTSSNVNLQVATGFTLNANDIIRLPLTGDSKVYPLARSSGDTSAPFKTTGPTIDKVKASTIKLPDGVKSGLYIITTGKQKECNTGDISISRLIKFDTSGGIGNTFRIITNNTDDLPKELPASVSSPVSALIGLPSNAPVSTVPGSTNKKNNKLSGRVIGASYKVEALAMQRFPNPS